ncbi:hypothetical protein CIG75_05780 [Tumebacillus algifaecis]|uniref:Uncharacterized protein n=1 Tax=Tumebacillus algifaecis TaxID=1214604 RepID=A0A223CZE7_9BACL|nr:hypothetical protein [Tumebacillus algifaecis]ASS74554.1 hypothetical protein CIG75_05780 [Tumebacillus algifaecis]
MAVSRMALFTCSALFAASALLSGCGKSDASQSGRAGIQQVDTAATTSLRKSDYKAFQEKLFQQLNLPADTKNQFRILETKNSAAGTYVLYSLPRNDGLAFAGRQADGSIVVHQARWPLAVTDPSQDLIVVRAIPPNNGINAPYGVLAGRVHNPFIETVEINYRDGHRERIDVSHKRGFIAVRKAFDTRFVQVRGYSTNGTPYWEIDTR